MAWLPVSLVFDPKRRDLRDVSTLVAQRAWTGPSGGVAQGQRGPGCLPACGSAEPRPAGPWGTALHGLGGGAGLWARVYPHGPAPEGHRTAFRSDLLGRATDVCRCLRNVKDAVNLQTLLCS